MCKRQEARESRVFSVSENIAVRRHKRTKVEKAEMAECIRHIKTTQPRRTKAESVRDGE